MRGNTESILNFLKEKFSNPLPGQEAQFRMAPSSRIRPTDPWQIPEGAQISAVLLLLYPEENTWKFPLMRRQPDSTAHSGQISLPGGKAEVYDESLEATALREAEEEMGIDPAKVSVLGNLTPLFIPVSNFFVQPVVAIQNSAPEFSPDPSEVAEILNAPVTHFHSEENRLRKNIAVMNNLRMDVPCYDFNGHIIWGATAMILSEFSEMIRR